MNKQETQDELIKLKEQAKKVGDIFAYENQLLYHTINLLSNKLNLLDKLPELEEEIDTIYKARIQIKELEQKIRETQLKAIQKSGFSKDTKLKDTYGTIYQMVNARDFRKLKKDGTISYKETAKSLGIDNLDEYTKL